VGQIYDFDKEKLIVGVIYNDKEIYDKALKMPCFGNYLITPEFIKKCKDLNVEIIIGNDRQIKGTRVKNSVSHN
jgi:hypothetical protein